MGLGTLLCCCLRMLCLAHYVYLVLASFFFHSNEFLCGGCSCLLMLLQCSNLLCLCFHLRFGSSNLLLLSSSLFHLACNIGVYGLLQLLFHLCHFLV